MKRGICNYCGGHVGTPYSAYLTARIEFGSETYANQVGEKFITSVLEDNPTAYDEFCIGCQMRMFGKEEVIAMYKEKEKIDKKKRDEERKKEEADEDNLAKGAVSKGLKKLMDEQQGLDDTT